MWTPLWKSGWIDGVPQSWVLNHYIYKTCCRPIRVDQEARTSNMELLGCDYRKYTHTVQETRILGLQLDISIAFDLRFIIVMESIVEMPGQSRSIGLETS